MNIKLLRRIQEQFRQHPESCNMDDYIPSAESPCGCIAGFALNLSGATHFTSGCDLLGLNDNNRKKLIWLQHWPADLKKRYKTDPARATIERIERFINSEGQQ